MAEAGRPTDLTEEMTLKIRGLYLSGKNYITIQEELGISPNTWDSWVYKDYKDFRKKLTSWKWERFVRKSEGLSEEILSTPHLDEKGLVDTNVLRIKQKEAEYVRSTLGKKDGYSTLQEVEVSDKRILLDE
jgi:hypothetical protein